MTLYEYIAVNNSSGANELLKNYGLRPTRSIDEIISRLKRIGNSQYGNSPVILLAIGFAVGYMIAKK